MKSSMSRAKKLLFILDGKKESPYNIEYGDSLIGPNVSLCNHQPCHVGCIQ